MLRSRKYERAGEGALRLLATKDLPAFLSAVLQRGHPLYDRRMGIVKPYIERVGGEIGQVIGGHPL